MFTNLDELKIQELKECSAMQTMEVLEALDKVSLSQMNYVTATETLDSYLLFIDVIKERICSGDLQSLSDETKKKFLQYIKRLQERLNNFKVISSFMHSNQQIFHSYVDKMQKETTEMFNKTTDELTAKLNETTKDHTGKLEAATKKLDDSEHNILTHVLTVMGVFSAIIVTMMSIVITTTSWLNTSNSSDAITAFTVPSAVIIVTVILLLVVVYGLYGDRKGRGFFYTYISIVAIGLAILVCQYKYSSDKIGEITHSRYIIESSQYEIVLNDNTQCYEFEVNGVKYVCPFDATLVHEDDSLHFCILHQAIE